jgi:hypothetical protein
MLAELLLEILVHLVVELSRRMHEERYKPGIAGRHAGVVEKGVIEKGVIEKGMQESSRKGGMQESSRKACRSHRERHAGVIEKGSLFIYSLMPYLRLLGCQPRCWLLSMLLLCCQEPGPQADRL